MTGAALRWRPLAAGDLDAVVAIADIVHPSYPERRAAFADKLTLAPEACFALLDERSFAGNTTDHDESIAGYAIGYPWRRRTIAPLDTVLGALPADAETLYVHDIAVLPAARGRGAAAAVIEHLAAAAQARGLPWLSLVAVYGAQALWARCGFVAVEDAALRCALAPYGAGARYMERPSAP